ncbi:zf-CCHC domain-containing protein/UBN2 domain-containing protein, partial [Cephalotus follicularis]
GIRAV